MNVYTSGDWRAMPGREDEFVDAWHEFAQWSVAELDHTAQATLLRDSEDPSHFVSFGSWRDAEVISRWRASEGYQTHVSKLKGLTESIKLTTLNVAAQTELVTSAR